MVIRVANALNFFGISSLLAKMLSVAIKIFPFQPGVCTSSYSKVQTSQKIHQYVFVASDCYVWYTKIPSCVHTNVI